MSELALSSAPQSIAAGLAAAFTSAVRKLRADRSARQAVKQLSQLDDRMLKDIGFYRTDLIALGSKYGSARRCLARRAARSSARPSRCSRAGAPRRSSRAARPSRGWRARSGC